MYVWKSYFSSILKKKVKIPLTKIKIKASRYFISIIISVLEDDEETLFSHIMNFEGGKLQASFIGVKVL
jgi:hypothetical protein